jgi:hypothetical protein
MTKSRKDKLAEAHQAYEAAKQGTKPKRRAKDGSIPTHPVVPCPDLPEEGEGGVKDLCYKWLIARRVLCNKHACCRKDGKLYGIKHSGDIHGYLPDGRGFEIECKRGKGGRLSKGQQERMQAVRATGGVYEVVHGVPELEHCFRGLL